MRIWILCGIRRAISVLGRILYTISPLVQESGGGEDAAPEYSATWLRFLYMATMALALSAEEYRASLLKELEAGQGPELIFLDSYSCADPADFMEAGFEEYVRIYLSE